MMIPSYIVCATPPLILRQLVAFSSLRMDRFERVTTCREERERNGQCNIVRHGESLRLNSPLKDRPFTRVALLFIILPGQIYCLQVHLFSKNILACAVFYSKPYARSVRVQKRMAYSLSFRGSLRSCNGDKVFQGSQLEAVF